VDLYDKIKQLREFTDLESSEVSEVCELLYRVAEYSDYLSDEFMVALEQEIDSNLKGYKDEFDVVEVEEVVPQRVVKVKALVERN
jgi:hypothetical protein